MSESDQTIKPASPPIPKPPGPVATMILAMISNSFFAVIILVIARELAHASARDLVVPFLILESAGLVFGLSVIWIERAPVGSKVRTRRVALSVPAYYEALVVAAVLTGIRLGIISDVEGLHRIVPRVTICLALFVPMLYGMGISGGMAASGSIFRPGRLKGYPFFTG